MNEADALDALNNKTCMFMLTWRGLGDRIINGDGCGVLVKTGSPFLTRSLSFIVPKNFKHTPALATATLELQGLFLVPSLEEYIEQKAHCEPKENHQLTPSHIYLFFVLVMVACLLIFLEMVFDRKRSFLDHL